MKDETKSWHDFIATDEFKEAVSFHAGDRIPDFRDALNRAISEMVVGVVEELKDEYGDDFGDIEDADNPQKVKRAIDEEVFKGVREWVVSQFS